MSDFDDDAVEMTDLEPAPGQLTPARPLPPWRRHITPRRFNAALRIAVIISILFLLLLVQPNSLTTLKHSGEQAISSLLPHSLPATHAPPHHRYRYDYKASCRQKLSDSYDFKFDSEMATC